MGKVKKAVLATRDVVSKWNVYILEAMRIISLVNSALILDVWRTKYHLSLFVVAIIGIVFVIFTIFMGWALIKYFKAAGYEILYDQIPQVKGTYDGTKRIEVKLDALMKEVEELKNAQKRK